ncbi:MAG TPA: hypothetical protein VMV21_03830 [Vicinamibacteria bacterium]|nr:hypothetical protein [Vicinamibacteria bacterium]
MRLSAAVCALTLLVPTLALAQAPPKPAPDQPVVAAYYYRVRWGFQEEFQRLFFKNHYPVLKAEMTASGPISSVLVFTPTFHGDGRADWTFLVVITYKNWAAMSQPREKGLLERLFPDQATFQKEEQRRFEIVEAHWDVPLTTIEPPKP